MRTLTLTADDHRIARLTAAAIAIALVESAVPSPLPGVKPGLANIITLLVLLRYDWVTAAWVTLLRVLAVSLLIGQFLAPGFVLSLGGALASLAMLYPAQRLVRRISGSLRGLPPDQMPSTGITIWLVLRSRSAIRRMICSANNELAGTLSAGCYRGVSAARHANALNAELQRAFA